MNTTLEDRFEMKVDRSPGLGPQGTCHLWKASTINGGYGTISSEGKKLLAHRLAWTLANGQVPTDMHVCHSCDTPSCVNSSHLFLGTQRENITDKCNKGRQAKGSTHGRAKLTEATVMECRARYLSGELQKDLANSFGVSRATMSFAINGVRWSHVA